MPPTYRPPSPGGFNVADLGFDPSDLNSLLSRYGLSAPSQPKQNFILPEPGTPGFFGRHPGVSRGIENALLAVASMGPPGATTGENISNVARSVLGIPGLREAHASEPYARALGAAQQIGQLQETQANLDLMGAHAQYWRGRAQMNPQDEYSDVHVDPVSGQFMGVSKRTGQVEVIPGETLNTKEPADHNTFVERLLDDRGITDPEDRWNETLKFYGASAGAKGAGGEAGRYSVPGAVTPQESEEIQTLRNRDRQLGPSFDEYQMNTFDDTMTKDAWSQERANVTQRLNDFQNNVIAPVRRPRGKAKAAPAIIAPPAGLKNPYR